MRLVSSGTEAAMSAIRLPRRNRPQQDPEVRRQLPRPHRLPACMGGSGIAQQGLKEFRGRDGEAIEDTIVAPYNVVHEIDETIAVVCVEPDRGEHGAGAPGAGLPRGPPRSLRRRRGVAALRRSHHRFSSVSRRRSWWFGVQPDVWCFGKVIGGGLPMGAYGASREIMSNVAPLGGVYQAGTLGESARNGCGPGGLEHLTVEAYAALAERATRLKRACRRRSSTPASPPCSRSVRCWASSSPIRRRTFRFGQGRCRQRRLPTVLPWDARPWHRPRTRCLRGDFPLARPRRREIKPHRCLRRGRRNPLTRLFQRILEPHTGFRPYIIR